MTSRPAARPKKNIQSVHRASTSMSADEVDMLDQVLKCLRAGADTRVLGRAQKHLLGRLAIRVSVMQASMKARQGRPQPPGRLTTDEEPTTNAETEADNGPH